MMPSPLSRAVVVPEQGRFQVALPSGTRVDTSYKTGMLGAMAKIFEPERTEFGPERFAQTVNEWSGEYIRAKANAPILDTLSDGRSIYKPAEDQVYIDPRTKFAMGHELAHSNQARTMGGFLRMIMMGPSERLYYGDDKQYTTKGTVEQEATEQGNVISTAVRNRIAKNLFGKKQEQFENQVEAFDPNRLVRNVASISAAQY